MSISVDENIIDFMIGDAEIIALVGARVYYLIPPASAAVPYILISSSGMLRESDLAGVKDMGVKVRFDVITVDAGEGRNIAEAARTWIDGYRGEIGGLSDCLITCSGVFPIVGTLRNQHSFDALIKYTEAV